MIYAIVSWNLFEYCLWFFNIAKYEWISDFNTLEFKENHPTIQKMRYIFFSLVFILTIPLFLKKSLDEL